MPLWEKILHLMVLAVAAFLLFTGGGGATLLLLVGYVVALARRQPVDRHRPFSERRARTTASAHTTGLNHSRSHRACRSLGGMVPGAGCRGNSFGSGILRLGMGHCGWAWVISLSRTQ